MNDTKSRYTTEEKLQIAETIFAQMGGKGRLASMIGAKDFAFSTDSDGNPIARFRFAAKAKNKANYVQVALTPADLYKVTFFRLRKFDFDNLGETEGVYSDMLVELFESETGLFLTF